MFYRCPFGLAKNFVTINLAFAFFLLMLVASSSQGAPDKDYPLTLNIYECDVERGGRLFKGSFPRNHIGNIILRSNLSFSRQLTVARQDIQSNRQTYSLTINRDGALRALLSGQVNEMLEQYYYFALNLVRNGVDDHYFRGPDGQNSIFQLNNDIGAIELLTNFENVYLDRDGVFYIAPSQASVDPLLDAMRTIQTNSQPLSPIADDFMNVVENQYRHFVNHPNFYSGILGIGPGYDIYALTGLQRPSSARNPERHFLGFLFEQRSGSGIERYFVEIDRTLLPRSSPSVARNISSIRRQHLHSGSSENGSLPPINGAGGSVSRQNSRDSDHGDSVFSSPASSPVQRSSFLQMLGARILSFRLRNRRSQSSDSSGIASGRSSISSSPGGSYANTARNYMNLGGDHENTAGIYMNLGGDRNGDYMDMNGFRVNPAGNDQNPAGNRVNAGGDYMDMNRIPANVGRNHQSPAGNRVNTGRNHVNSPGNNVDLTRHASGDYVELVRSANGEYLYMQGAISGSWPQQGSRADRRPNDVRGSSQPAEASSNGRPGTASTNNGCGQCSHLASE